MAEGPISRGTIEGADTKGKFKLVKISKDKPEQRLAGAEFELYNQNTKERIILITDDKGEAVTDTIKGGEYLLRELKAPVGYKIDKEYYDLNLNFKGNEGISKTITNDKKIYNINIEVVEDQDDKKILEDIKISGKNLGDSINIFEKVEGLDSNIYTLEKVETKENINLSKDYILTIDENSPEEINIKLIYSKAKTSYLIKYSREDYGLLEENPIEHKTIDKDGKIQAYYGDSLNLDNIEVKEFKNYEFTRYDLERNKSIEKNIKDSIVLEREKEDNVIYLVYRPVTKDIKINFVDEDGNTIRESIDFKNQKINTEINLKEYMKDIKTDKYEYKYNNSSKEVEDNILLVEDNETITLNFKTKAGYKIIYKDQDGKILGNIEGKTVGENLYYKDEVKVDKKDLEVANYNIVSIKRNNKDIGDTIILEKGIEDNTIVVVLEAITKSYKLNFLDEDGNIIRESKELKDQEINTKVNLEEYLIDYEDYKYKDYTSEIEDRIVGGEFIVVEEDKDLTEINIRFRTKANGEIRYILKGTNKLLKIDEINGYRNDKFIIDKDNFNLNLGYRFLGIVSKDGYVDRIELVLDKNFDKNIVIVELEERENSPAKPEDKDTGYIDSGRPIVSEVKGEIKIEDKLDKENHIQYIQGYTDNTVRPEANISREEIATVFFRLLNEEYRESVRSTENNFTDISEDRWSNKHISTMANANIIKGYEDGNFKGEQFITRGELATVVSRFDKLEKSKTSVFKDTKNHWSEEYIDSAVNKGWINGYEDGTFRPDNYITRGEFVTLVNRVLDRGPSVKILDKDLKQYNDLQDKGKWYYFDMIEALNSHEYTRDKENGQETWIKLTSPKIEM